DRPHDLSRPRAVPRHGDAEPDRVGGDVPAPGGTGRPLHAQGRDRLPGARRGAHDRPAPARRAAGAAAGALARRSEGAPARRLRGARRRARPAHRPRRRERRLSSLRLLQRTPTPEAPGPGQMPEALLRALDFTIGRRIESLLAGDYRSTLLGHGTELAQVRPYVPGDDVRLIDWNVTARTLEPHVRVHLAERVLVTW